MEKEIYDLYKRLAIKCNLTNGDIKKLWSMIENICKHPEFQKRCYAPFFHHDIKTLGEHILNDTIVTYKIAKDIKKNHRKIINIELAVYIAMFHDLYEIPWQNTFQKKKFRNKHGFSHPLEAIINAITWYPEYFKSKDNALIIIDGVIHHMFPFPVRAIDNTNLELNNQEKYEKLPDRYKKMIFSSTSIGKVGHYSLRKSFFLEGRILSKADKIVAMKTDLKGLNGYLAMINGHNKKIDKIEEK